jgi:hypothetical protein
MSSVVDLMMMWFPSKNGSVLLAGRKNSYVEEVRAIDDRRTCFEGSMKRGFDGAVISPSLRRPKKPVSRMVRKRDVSKDMQLSYELRTARRSAVVMAGTR